MKIFLSVIISLLIVCAAIFVSRFGVPVAKPDTLFPQKQQGVPIAPQNNVSVIDGIQVIEIVAKGGYLPKQTTAKSDLPTIIRVKTQGTLDCSAALTVPVMGYEKILPQSGITDIDVSAQKSGTTLRGVCSMGMYGFEIRFE